MECQEGASWPRLRMIAMAEEIELNRHIAHVAAQRRALPPGGQVKGDYQFMDRGTP